jgi:MerR family copper efflux transcriptional regulator
MARSVPIACTLGATGLAAQRRRWERLMTEALTGREETPDGLRLSFRPGAEDELRALVAIERECCPWASWTVMAGPGEVTLGIRAPAEGAAVLYEMFRAAPGGPSGARASASSPGQARSDTRR